jgi:hypothetical protein
MSDSAEADGVTDEVVVDAGNSTDQHITGDGETGTFITDEEPTAGTPSHGSSNAGINEAGGNR